MCLNGRSFLFLPLFLLLTGSDELPTCQPNDFQYSFTECDEFGGRWRVSVPTKPDHCTGGAPNAPIRVKKCFTSCDSGNFFNSTTLECEKCSKGSYSMGGGVKFSAFNGSTLSDSGFHINTESPKSKHCPGWRVKDSMISYVLTNQSTEGCVSVLTYTVKIVKKGTLKFVYQYLLPDDYSTVLFTFQHRNYQDVEGRGAGIDGYNIKFPSVTREQQKWNYMDVTLRKPGLYVFIWKGVLFSNARSGGMFYSKRQAVESPSRNYEYEVIRIKSIEVFGIAYTSECTKCEVGTYTSEEGAAYCKLCPRDTYSPHPGATKCINCTVSQYAPPGSSNCFEKPECNENDYYEVIGECDVHKKKQRVITKFIEPKICRDTSYQTEHNSRSTPFTKYQSCNSSTVTPKLEKCSPGMELRNNTCYFCPENYFNDGSRDTCEKCPASTLPEYAFVLDTWQYNIAESPLLHLSSQCVLENSMYDEECESDIDGWKMTPASKSYIRSSSRAVLNSFLLLTLSVEGFRSADGGELSFTYEIVCVVEDECNLLFVETKGQTYLQQVTDKVKEWKGDSGGIQIYKHSIKQNSSLSFAWIFKRKSFLQSHTRIYNISLTNSIGSGAVRCKACPHGAESACVPCTNGHYLGTEIQHIHKEGVHTHIQAKKCLQCPPNTKINSSISFPIGKESCIECGEGLRNTSNNAECYSDCRFTLDGDHFDWSRMKQPLFMKGSHLFTSGGTQYFHFFNITLCGLKRSVCASNVSNLSIVETGIIKPEVVESMVCRSTIVPDPNNIYVTQPVSLGDELIGISKSSKYKNISVHKDFANYTNDIHLYYVTKMPTVACKMGRTLVVTLRCSMTNLEPKLSTPKSCPDGTCDGCNFHILIETKAACRRCKEKDYETLVGECVNGVQHIHYINPKACTFSFNETSVIKHRTCSAIPKQVQLGIILVSFLGVLLLTLVFHFWKKNRRLEYKYSKLVENKNTADCCAEDEDDDDDCDGEEVKIRQPKKERSLLDNGYETIQLTKQSDDETM